MSRLRATLDGPLWPYVLEKYRLESYAAGRSMALEILGEIADVDIQILNVFTQHKLKGWDYKDFAKKVKQSFGSSDGAEVSIGVLSEYALVSLTATSDCNGWFVAVTWPSPSRPHRRLFQLILRRWFLEERGMSE